MRIRKPHSIRLLACLILGLIAGVSVSAKETVELAITIDDLPALDTANTRKIIQALKKHDIQNVYGFINGHHLTSENEIQKARSERSLALWLGAGHRLGNHGFRHLGIRDAGAEEMKRDIDLNDEILTRYGMADPRIYRYPYLKEGLGSGKGEIVRRHLRKKGYKIAHGSLGLDDWIWSQAYGRCIDRQDAAAITKLQQKFIEYAAASLKVRTLLATKLLGRDIKHILYIHWNPMIADTMDALITRYEAEGVSFISLEEAMSDPLYRGYQDIVLPNGPDILYKTLIYRKMDAAAFIASAGINLNFPIQMLQTICSDSR